MYIYIYIYMYIYIYVYIYMYICTYVIYDFQLFSEAYITPPH